ncbi:DUF839 domain-containing protein [Limnobacter humi]|uniref:DUF839 domain-containing protein n=1 Tax=Limnobacter humi TaxID=1778671 RepID=A0ABT1WJN6_9BURK|nr:alkaline phosphatase PhoX [Limnobacter humi]MCQ8897724.1 DUF839 domain-containing protein [Limnobacter humi]
MQDFDDDITTNLSNTPHLDDIIEAALTSPGRRDFIKAGAAGVGMLSLTGCLGGGNGASAATAAPTVQSLSFTPSSTAAGSTDLTALLDDNIKLPAGYTYEVLYRTGDPLVSTDPLGNPIPAHYNGTDYTANVPAYPASSWQYRAGDHHDGGHYFGMNAAGKFDPKATDRALLAINHENIAGTAQFIHGIATASITSNPRADITVGAVTTTAADQVRKEVNAHGVSVFEIRRDTTTKRWSVVVDSPFNKRYTAGTVMSMGGPAAAKKYFVTKFSPTGELTRGTLNNCAAGYTPWGTYLTCEENWPFYFRSGPNATPVTGLADGKGADKNQGRYLRLARYGLGTISGDASQFTPSVGSEKFWSTAGTTDEFARWDVTASGTTAADDFRNAANTFGYVVEIDPFDPSAVPRKRTAMGRFYHEGAWLGPVAEGKPIVYYMGCDSRNEYIYKYVSTKNWNPADASLGILAGDLYLNDGTLYVAKFNSDGTGVWLPLTRTAVNAALGNLPGPYNGLSFNDDGDVLIHTRIAADAVGGTRMDRPEWGAVNPKNGEVYFTLTKSSRRTAITAAGQTQGAFVTTPSGTAAYSQDRPVYVDPANPRSYQDVNSAGTGTGAAQNANGHIIRFAEANANPAATAFRWDIYLFGAEIRNTAAGVNVSALTAQQDFSSPDGCWFSPTTGILWIQTDDDAYTDVTNCMLLASVPGKVGDGGPVTIGTGVGAVNTFKGKNLSESQLRRFLVGPRDAEITGLMESPDGKTLFINIQHPGENTGTSARAGTSVSSPSSSWPQPNTDPKVGNNATGNPTGNTFPRSATIAIYRNDGGVIGGDLVA